MTTEAMPKEIAEAVIAMMVKVGYVQKKGENTFQNYKYASIEGILEKVQPALADVGLVIVQNELGAEIVGDGNLMQAAYTFTLAHKSGTSWGPIRHSSLSAIRNSKGGYDDKALNKCHTAARKYFILGLFQIPTGLAADPDEDDGDRPAAAPPPRAPSPVPSRTAAPQSKTAANPAEEWAGKQTDVIRTLSSMSALKDWEKKNDPTLARLKTVNPKLHTELEALLGDMRGQLSNFGIAAE